MSTDIFELVQNWFGGLLKGGVGGRGQGRKAKGQKDVGSEFDVQRRVN